MEELALFEASFVSRGHIFQQPKLSSLMVHLSSTNVALMAEAARHPGTISLSLSIPSLEMWAASPPLSRIGLGLGLDLERGEVGLAVASLGDGNGPLRMVLMDGT